MMNNFFKHGFRRIANQPLFSVIKYIGLTIGISCVILISIWVQNELSYDKFHPQSQNIYRVIMNMGENGNLALTPSPLITKMQSDFPELEHSTRVENCPKMTVKNEDKYYYESGGIFADHAFFDVFSFELLQGNKSNLLNSPFDIVISEALATKYFGNNDVINKTLTVHGYPLQIKGVLKNVLANSHLQFDFILPIQLKTQLGDELDNWGDVNLYTYIKTKEHTDFTTLNEKVKNWKTPRSETFFLQPLLNIHRETDIVANNAKVTNKKYVYIFSSIALLILLIACINYITLFLSSAYSRSKEIGIMKIVGSNRKMLMLNFVCESAIYIIISLISAYTFIQLFMPIFNQINGAQLSFSFANWRDLLGAFLLGIILLLIIGIYPAIHLSSLKPSSIFKNNIGGSVLIARFKNGMVLLQFSITTLLIVCILQVSKQLNYIQNKDLGFKKENVIYMPFSGMAKHYPAFKQKLLENSSILNVTIKNSLPIEVADKTNELSWPGKTPETQVLIEATGVGYNYFETMGISIIEGRDFSPEYASEKMDVILNQKAVKMMGLTDPVGKTIQLWDYTGNIIGVINDALFYSLKENVAPQIYYQGKDNSDESLIQNGVLLVKVKDSNITETIETIKSVWTEFAPESPFDYHFLDQAIDKLYWSEERMYAIMKYFVFISIFLSCLGLFGVATFSIQQRTKEIGIRKVNGATISEILAMLNRDFVKWVAIAFVIATPIAWYAMYKWLENFAYKTELSWWIFALAGLLALGIALLTVSWQSWKAATRNPVEALRYE